jgi:ribose/xylose/arabinose/galactoside ABC-type transport system permease subunit
MMPLSQTEIRPGSGGPPAAGETKGLPASRTAMALRHGLGEHAGLLIALLALIIFLSLGTDNFLSAKNLLNVSRQVAFTGIIAFGMTLVIVAAEIDISVGSAIGFGSAALGILVAQSHLSIWLAVTAVILVGTAVGLLAGTLRAKAAVPSFIVTLGLFSALRGGAFWMTDALPQSIEDDGFAALGSGNWSGIPIPTIIMFAVFGLFWVLANRTAFGRSVYAIGGNAEAARLSGIPVARTRILLFGITGALAAVSGVLQSAQFGSGNPSIGSGVEFDVITAVIVGGASLYGGRGSMVGTLLGVFFIGFLRNGMVLLGVDPYAQGVASGLIVLIAVLISTQGGQVKLRLQGLIGSAK